MPVNVQMVNECLLINVISKKFNLKIKKKNLLGYEGYGCTDARNAQSKATLLASVLMLTLSNLIFILPIFLAIRKRLFVEALIYFYNMFFSTVNDSK